MKQIIIITAFVFLMLIGIASASEITRTISPTQVETGKTFILTYTSTATGTWGASIQESLSGGCKFPDGTSSYKTVMLSADGATKLVTITTPSTASTCTLTGDYKFGTDAIKTFQSKSIIVGTGGTCTPKTCSQLGKTCGTTDNGCGTTINCGTGNCTEECKIFIMDKCIPTAYVIIGGIALLMFIFIIISRK